MQFASDASSLSPFFPAHNYKPRRKETNLLIHLQEIEEHPKLYLETFLGHTADQLSCQLLLDLGTQLVYILLLLSGSRSLTVHNLLIMTRPMEIGRKIWREFERKRPKMLAVAHRKPEYEVTAFGFKRTIM